MANDIRAKDSLQFCINSADDSFATELWGKIREESERLNQITLATQPLNIKVTKNGVFIGGVVGYYLYGSIVIDILWVDPAYRHKGIGSELLSLVEQTAQKNNIEFITVSTMSFWNASSFYTKHGFTLEGERKGYVKGFTQLHFIKKIKSLKNETS